VYGKQMGKKGSFSNFDDKKLGKGEGGLRRVSAALDKKVNREEREREMYDPLSEVEKKLNRARARFFDVEHERKVEALHHYYDRVVKRQMDRDERMVTMMDQEMVVEREEEEEEKEEERLGQKERKRIVRQSASVPPEKDRDVETGGRYREKGSTVNHDDIGRDFNKEEMMRNTGVDQRRWRDRKLLDPNTGEKGPGLRAPRSGSNSKYMGSGEREKRQNENTNTGEMGPGLRVPRRSRKSMESGENQSEKRQNEKRQIYGSEGSFSGGGDSVAGYEEGRKPKREQKVGRADDGYETANHIPNPNGYGEGPSYGRESGEGHARVTGHDDTREITAFGRGSGEGHVRVTEHDAEQVKKGSTRKHHRRARPESSREVAAVGDHRRPMSDRQWEETDQSDSWSKYDQSREEFEALDNTDVEHDEHPHDLSTTSIQQQYNTYVHTLLEAHPSEVAHRIGNIIENLREEGKEYDRQFRFKERINALKADRVDAVRDLRKERQIRKPNRTSGHPPYEQEVPKGVSSHPDDSAEKPDFEVVLSELRRQIDQRETDWPKLFQNFQNFRLNSQVNRQKKKGGSSSWKNHPES